MDLFTKKFDDDLAQYLKEDITNPTIPSSGNAELGLSPLEQITTLEKINSVLAGITDSPALNPYYLVERVRERLQNVLGLTFENTYLMGDTGTVEKILEPMYAPTGGRVHDAAKWTQDNGFLKLFPGGLKVRFTFLKVNRVYTVGAEVITLPTPTPAAVSEN